MKFILEGKFKPYVRMTQRSKFANPEAKKYLSSKDDLRRQYKTTMARHGWEKMNPQQPLKVSVEIQMGGRLHVSDLDNQLKALMDAAQGVVFPNDCWIDHYEKVTRELGNEHVTTVTFDYLDCAK